MRVVYEPPIMDRLRDLRTAAIADRRVIQKVVLNRREAGELHVWLAEIGVFATPTFRGTTVLGLIIEVEHDPRDPPSR